MSNHPRIGVKDCSADVYVLVLEDFVEALEPPAGFKLGRLDPKQYFITSGDAIHKTVQLERDMMEYAGKITSIANKYPSNKALARFKSKCWSTAIRVRSLKKALERARGKHVFMECEWEDGNITVTPKDPRARKPA